MKYLAFSVLLAAVLLSGCVAPSQTSGDMQCSEITNQNQCAAATNCPANWTCMWNPNADACACYHTCEKDADCQNNFKCEMDSEVNKKTCMPGAAAEEAQEEAEDAAKVSTALSLQGDFEEQISSDCWKFMGSHDQHEGVSADAHGGTRSISITNLQANASYWQTAPGCTVPAESGKDYEFSAWVKTGYEGIANKGDAYVLIEFLSSTNDILDSKSSDKVKVVKEGDWAQVEVKEEAPIGTTRIKIKLILSGTGVALFDDLEGSVK